MATKWSLIFLRFLLLLEYFASIFLVCTCGILQGRVVLFLYCSGHILCRAWQSRWLSLRPGRSPCFWQFYLLWWVLLLLRHSSIWLQAIFMWQSIGRACIIFLWSFSSSLWFLQLLPCLFGLYFILRVAFTTKEKSILLRYFWKTFAICVEQRFPLINDGSNYSF